jgi:hypothetical protein
MGCIYAEILDAFPGIRVDIVSRLADMKGGQLQIQIIKDGKSAF